MTDADRLEELWSGEFGDVYTDRNLAAGERRAQFWQTVLDEFPARRVLEVGCNLGSNLRWIVSRVPPGQVCGVDINVNALGTLKRELPQVNAVWARARDLPFRDRAFDLVFTVGVLIHQPSDMLPTVMGEIVRCADRYVLCGEYYAAEPTEVPYHGQRSALFKRDFGGLYQELFPDLGLRRQGFLPRADGWDDVTYWVFEKSRT